MAKTGMFKAITLVLLASASIARGEAETAISPLRLWSISRDAFDYVFMSASKQADDTHILAFKSRSGRTSFLRVGDLLDGWTIASYTPRTVDAKNPRTGLMEKRDAGLVVLKRPDGRERTLKQGQLHQIQGYRVTFIDTDTGQRHSARSGEQISWRGGKGTVAGVKSDSVTLHSKGTTALVPRITEAEFGDLRRRVGERRRVARAAAERDRQVAERKAAQAWAQNAVLLPPPPEKPLATFDRNETFVAATYGPIPVEYTVLPPQFDARGNMIRPAIVIPTRFEMGQVDGVSVSPDARGVTVQRGAAGIPIPPPQVIINR